MVSFWAPAVDDNCRQKGRNLTFYSRSIWNLDTYLALKTDGYKRESLADTAFHSTAPTLNINTEKKTSS